MNKLVYALLAAALILCNCSTRTAQPAADKLTCFADSLFGSAMDSGYIAGAGIIVFQHDRMLLDKAYGYASLELKVPMPENASFEIGSVTKQFTAAAILRLHEEGLLDLEDDLNDYVEFDTKGRRVTINHLLNHSSGIPGYTELPWFGKIMGQHLERDSLLRLVEQHDFLFEPGEALIYNNTGYFLLGMVIEKASGMSYEDYLREQFFNPLKMEQSYYSSNSKVIPRRANGYGYRNGKLVQKQYIDYRWPYSAGSLSSSTKDLLTWMRALHAGALLEKDSYERMSVPGTLNDGSPVRYAMGLVNQLSGGHREITHGGGIPGFLSSTHYFPDDELYVICLVNTAGPRGSGFFTKEIIGQLLEEKSPETIKLDINPRLLSGTYAGQGRGQKVCAEIKGKENFLILTLNEKSDTLDNYVGNACWQEGNLIISFRNNKLHLDERYGHLVLEKVD